LVDLSKIKSWTRGLIWQTDLPYLGFEVVSNVYLILLNVSVMVLMCVVVSFIFFR